MLATLQTVLRRAAGGRYAVGAFNVSNLEHVQAVIAAATALRAPVVINVSAKAIAYAGLEPIAGLIKLMAKKAPVPVVLDLDHGREVALALACLRQGFTGIMFDAGRLPYADNVRLTRRVVQAGHRRRVGVEGELGQVKYPSDWRRTARLFLTDPLQARDFVQKTGVDALAVAIGNSHGLPRPGERLDFARLAAIRRLVAVPLVLHGASGTPAADIRRAISLGVAKINIDTDLRLAFTNRLRLDLPRHRQEFDPRFFLDAARSAMTATVRKKIVLFGGKGKAQ